MSIIAE